MPRRRAHAPTYTARGHRAKVTSKPENQFGSRPRPRPPRAARHRARHHRRQRHAPLSAAARRVPPRALHWWGAVRHPARTGPSFIYFLFCCGLIWGSEVVFVAETHKLVRKVARRLPQACRIGAVEAVVWVRGRRVGGAKSFLDKGGPTSIVAIQEQKYYALLGPPKRTGNEKKWGIRPGGSLEHGEESLLEPANVPIHPLELPLNPFLTGVGQLSYPTCIWVLCQCRAAKLP